MILDISGKTQTTRRQIKFKIRTRHPVRVATIPSSGGVERGHAYSGAGEPFRPTGLTARTIKSGLKDRLQALRSVLRVGPGSGKTTTLHSILKFLNTPDTKIWTADPVESPKGLRQVRSTKAGIDFALVMRAFLRTDPTSWWASRATKKLCPWALRPR
jgi:type II secretory ATPase GspE/PulE/Tfp pilus assembly ATPase PilB-like protein